jgi:hypothetical protein
MPLAGTAPEAQPLVTPADYTAAASSWQRLADAEREEAAGLIAQRGFAYYCAGPGSRAVCCTSLDQWDDAVAGRPLRARSPAGH